MYEVKLTPKSRKQFIATVRRKMISRGWKMEDLAKEINRPVSSVSGFFYKNSIQNRFMAAEIAKALDINPRGFM